MHINRGIEKEKMPEEQKELRAIDLFRAKKMQLERTLGNKVSGAPKINEFSSEEAKFGAEGMKEKGTVEASQLTIFTKEISIKNAEREEKQRAEKIAKELEEKKKEMIILEKLKKYGKQKLIKNNVLQKLREVHA